ncbi:hypothetical protein GE09DRAFT_213666 [Coniochaeta sp. 2T2.1]|nr:hypothetical protein GE09DRAFT_213666 [Coniochaeta sp. 2T2.1]
MSISRLSSHRPGCLRASHRTAMTTGAVDVRYLEMPPRVSAKEDMRNRLMSWRCSAAGFNWWLNLLVPEHFRHARMSAELRSARHLVPRQHHASMAACHNEADAGNQRIMSGGGSSVCRWSCDRGQAPGVWPIRVLHSPQGTSELLLEPLSMESSCLWRGSSERADMSLTTAWPRYSTAPHWHNKVITRLFAFTTKGYGPLTSGGYTWLHVKFISSLISVCTFFFRASSRENFKSLSPRIFVCCVICKSRKRQERALPPRHIPTLIVIPFPWR